MRIFYFQLFWLLAGTQVFGVPGAAEQLQTLAKAPDNFERAAALEQLAHDTPKTQLPQLLEAAHGLKRHFGEQALQVILSHWATKDPQTAFEATQKLPGGLWQRESSMTFFKAWGYHDPQAAFETIAAHRKTGQSAYMLDGFWEGYADKDPLAAFAFWLEQRDRHPEWLSNFDSKCAGRIFNSAMTRAPKQMLDAVLAIKDNRTISESTLLNPLMKNWFEADPEGAIKACAQSAVPHEQKIKLIRALAYSHAVKAQQAPSVTKLIDRLARGHEASSLYHSLFNSIAWSNPADAFDGALKIEASQKRDSALRGVLTSWVQKNPEQALARIGQIEHDDLRAQCTEQFWKTVGYMQSDKALDFIRKIEDPKQQRRALFEYAGSSVYSHNFDIDAFLEKLPDPQERQGVLRTMLKNARYDIFESNQNTKNLKSLRKYALELPPSQEKIQVLTSLLDPRDIKGSLQWINENTQGVQAERLVEYLFSPNRNWHNRENVSFEVYQLLPDGRLRDEVLPYVAQSMALKQPEIVAQWLSEMPASWARNAAYGAYVGALAKNDPQAAIEALQNAPENYVPAGEISDIAFTYASKDPAAALQWSLEIGNDSLRTQALTALANAWGKNDPLLALQTFRALEDEKLSNMGIYNTAINWAQKDPEQARQWVEVNVAQDPKAAAQVTSALMESWVSLDPQAASQWMADLPEGQQRIAAIVGLAQSRELYKSPDAVLEWVMTLPADEKFNYGRHPTDRKTLMTRTLERLKYNDRKALEAFSQRTDISQAERNLATAVLNRE